MNSIQMVKDLLSQEAREFLAGMVVDHLDGVVGEAAIEEIQAMEAEGADSMWELQ